MKLGVITALLYDRSLDEALGYIKNFGVESVEMGASVQNYSCSVCE